MPEKARTTVYALDSCFGAVLGSFGSPLVGILAERVFGYQPGTPGKSAEADRKNADALSRAIFSESAGPFIICCLTYTFLYCTYPRDRERARKELLMASADQLGEEGSDREQSAVRALGDEESSVRSLNQRLISRGE